jgi:hypothetical protein
MNAVVFLSDGVRATLTTDSPASHNGIPVLRLEYATGETLDLRASHKHEDGISAAEIVKSTSWCFDSETLAAARRFCAQWPEGPQIDPGE